MGFFAGILSHDWKMLTAKNSIRPKYWPIKWYYDIKSRSNDKIYQKEHERYADSIRSVSIEKDPIFILGHWRSGTTMLHNTLCKDQQFAFPSLLEAYNPHTFLTVLDKIQADKKSQQSVKRPMDNVQVNYKSPAEDEFALSLLSLCSPVLGWAFPKNRDFYDKYLLLDDISDEEAERWHSALRFLMKKLTFKYNKQLVLKSPQHTARIKQILQIFPNAKFVHFRRNPYDVFKSTLELYTKTVRSLSFQAAANNNVEDYIIKKHARNVT